MQTLLKSDWRKSEVSRDPVRRSAWKRLRKAQAREFIANVRAETVCHSCGAQPVDFHRKEHEAVPHFRVAFLAAQGRSAGRIQQEIDLSVALCRKCHMALDGRGQKLAAYSIARKRESQRQYAEKKAARVA